MFLNIFQCAEGIFKKDFKQQFLVTLSVTLLTFCHGIGLGWLSPMVSKLQSPQETPLEFVIDVEQTSWLGAFISVGGLIGNFSFSLIMNRFGRKTSLYLLVIPHLCVWILLYFAQSIEWLYVARVLGGTTGGGSFVVLPIFIGEISDNSIRGRLSSLFPLSINMGMLTGFIVSTHLPYHLIPCVVIALPLLYLYLLTRFPESPHHLLQRGRFSDAENSLRFYYNYKRDKSGAIVAGNKTQELAFHAHFEELRQAITHAQLKSNDGLSVHDFCNKRAFKAFVSGLILMMLNMFSGTFAFINYMSSIFQAVHTELHPNTNTIIIGVVQIVGTFAAIYLVDRYGRKCLLVISSAGVGLGTALFGMYAFFAEEMNADLSAYSAWLPVTIMAFIIFLTSVGINSVCFVVVVEILPPKIREIGTSICLSALSTMAFCSLKLFPVLMQTFGLSATMWFCSSICAFGLFYVSVFLEETKGKSMHDEVQKE